MPLIDTDGNPIPSRRPQRPPEREDDMAEVEPMSDEQLGSFRLRVMAQLGGDMRYSHTLTPEGAASLLARLDAAEAKLAKPPKQCRINGCQNQ